MFQNWLNSRVDLVIKKYNPRRSDNMYPAFNENRLQMYTPQCPPNVMLAHAYVPVQCLNCVYPPMEGLCRGTIFPELDRPYGADPEYTVDK